MTVILSVALQAENDTNRCEDRFFLASAESVRMLSRCGADFFSFFFMDLHRFHTKTTSVVAAERKTENLE